MFLNANDSYATHPNPARRKEANFLIAVEIDGNEKNRKWEQLWCEQLDSYRFKVSCIPFFTWEIDLGDEVETTEKYIFTRVIKPSGFKTHRIWFGDATEYDGSQVAMHLEKLGAEVEWSSKNLLAISVSSAEINVEVLNYLFDQHTQKKLIYESVM